MNSEKFPFFSYFSKESDSGEKSERTKPKSNPEKEPKIPFFGGIEMREEVLGIEEQSKKSSEKKESSVSELKPEKPHKQEYKGRDHDLIEYLKLAKEADDKAVAEGYGSNELIHKALDGVLGVRGGDPYMAVRYVSDFCAMYVANPEWAKGKNDEIQALVKACRDLLKNYERDVKYDRQVLERFLSLFEKE